MSVSVHRRDWLRLALAASLGPVVPAARSQPIFEVDPFQLGVASGMPAADSVVLWTRLLPANTLRNPWEDTVLDVRWELAEDAAMSRPVRSGAVQALPQLGHSVHVEVEGLEAGRTYHYRFRSGEALSPVGRTRTAPAPDAEVPRLRLAVASCQRLASGYLGAWRRVLDDEIDLVAFLGDYIYDSGARPSPTVPQGLAPALDLAGYRAHYELHKRSAALQAAHAAVPWLVGWDDHEVFNDYAGGPLRAPADNRAARQRRAAYQAWYEHMPVRRAALIGGLEGLTRDGAELRVYGRHAWGRLAALHLLDCRQYRDAQACSGLRGLVDPAGCEALAEPARSMLGAEQEAWLDRQLATQGRGQAQPWNLLLQSTLFSPRRIPLLGAQRIWNDGWDGYPAARRRLIDSLRRHDVSGPVLLGGDLHEHWACNVPATDDPAAAEARPVASEFVTTGITMTSFVPGMIRDIQAANPHAVYADAGRAGYGLLTLEPAGLRMDFKVLDSTATMDPAVRTTASFTATPDDPTLRAG